jgi:hypothetical protein
MSHSQDTINARYIIQQYTKYINLDKKIYKKDSVLVIETIDKIYVFKLLINDHVWNLIYCAGNSTCSSVVNLIKALCNKDYKHALLNKKNESNVIREVSRSLLNNQLFYYQLPIKDLV